MGWLREISHVIIDNPLKLCITQVSKLFDKCGFSGTASFSLS